MRFGIAVLAAAALIGHAVHAQSPQEQRLIDLTNEARAQAGLKPVVWDAKLADAARAHAVLMTQQAEISHQYQGEPDLAVRAASAGAHFSVIAENIAMGTSPGQIHGAWMNSKGHHDNLMNANVDHIGVALVPARGALFAVVDFTQAVTSLSPADVEAKVGAAIQQAGAGHPPAFATDPAVLDGARKYCGLDDGASSSGLGIKAQFLMRWQSPDIAKLPPELEKALASGHYTQAAIGACDAKGGSSSGPVFSGYRVAVLLY